MTRHLHRRLGGLLLASALGAAALVAAPPAPAAADPKRAVPADDLPAPCARPTPVRSTALPAEDNDAAEAANAARVADLQARYPDRQLSPYSTLNEIGEGWRYGWKGGQMRYVTFLNRAGAMLVGTAFAPDPVRCPGRRPAVLLTEGITANEVLYWWQAQSLAEAGYAVLTFDYMNQGLSESTGHTADGGTVPAVGGDRGADPASGFLQDAQDALDFLLSSPANPHRFSGPVLDSDAPFDAAFPFAAQVDARLVGLTGHSEGARIASVLQGIDQRPGALVALDNLASRLKGDPGSSSSQCVEGGLGVDELPVVPRVPAMGQAAPNNTVCDDPELKKFAYEKWRAAGIPAMQVVVAGSRHADWSPTPAVAEGNADVPELAAYWSIGWFDRWLLRDPGAELRVLTRSVDLFDHYTGPFRRTAAELYDTTFTSSAETGTNSCPNLLAACAAVLPVVTEPAPPPGEGRGKVGDPGRSGGSDSGRETTVGPPLPGAPPVSVPVALPGLAPGAVTPPVTAPGAPPQTDLLFAPSPVASATTGAGALVALPLAGALLGIMVLVGFRRHEGRARRLGVLTS